MTKKVVPIVEGHGEEDAVPILLRKLICEHLQACDIEVDRPIRKKRSELVNPDELARWVRIAAQVAGCVGIVVIFDADDDCAATLGPQLTEFAREHIESIPVYVVLAVREYESWLLASIDSLKGKAGLRQDPELPSGGPESKRDAKGWIERNMIERPYVETLHQAKMTNWLDVNLAAKNSRSFRKLLNDVEDLVERVRDGLPSDERK